MRVKDKINMDMTGLTENGPINIVIFGDSVSHGAFAGGEIDYEAVYWNRLKKKINAVRNYVPVNMICAAIGGTSARCSLPRLEKQVLKHEPDLTIVMFGLNDVNGDLDDYLSALREIFTRLQASGSDVIFMTPNMLNTSVSDEVEKQYAQYAVKTAEMQNGGRMDSFMFGGMKVACEMGVPVCDCYSKWKKLSETQDITCLLANKINHPTREMHELFAQSLFEMIFDENAQVNANDSTMYQAK